MLTAVKFTVEVDGLFAEYLKKFPQDKWTAQLVKAMEVGVTVLQRLQVSNDVEFVKKENELLVTKVSASLNTMLTDLVQRIELTMNKSFNPAVTDSYLAKTVEHLRNQLREMKDQMTGTVSIMLDNAGKMSTDKVASVEKLFHDADAKFNPEVETSYLGKVKRVVFDLEQNMLAQLDFMKRDSFASQLLDHSKKAFGAESEAVRAIIESVYKQRMELQTSIDSLRDTISGKEGADEMLQHTAIKGFNFEDDLYDVLSEIASTYGDTVEYTGGDTSKVDTSKKGDYLYTFAEGQSIVIEAKDTPVGLKPMLKYLDEAMKNRGVEFSMLVTKTAEQLQKQIGELNIYESSKMFVASENIRFAIRLARIYVVQLHSDTVDGDGIDKKKIAEAIKNIGMMMKSIKVVKQKLTAMLTSVQEGVAYTAEQLDEMRSTVDEQLSVIQQQFD